jgi:predicted MFS family arabinose efflux permease
MLPFNLAQSSPGGDDRHTHDSPRSAPTPTEFLMVLGFVNTLGFAGWQALINNFAREQAGFGWYETGLNQSMRELPGLLAFTAIFWLIWMREQSLAYVSLVLASIGIALTGFFPTLGGILLTTLFMSIGFHYFETASHSLQLQLLRQENAAREMGRIQSASWAAQFVAYTIVFALTAWSGLVSYTTVFLVIALAGMLLTWQAYRRFPKYEGAVVQRKTLVLRRRYGLYYALTFMSGARRQIFVAFGAFLLVDRFGLGVDKIALLYLVTAFASTLMAPWIGRLIGRIGERRTMILENLILILVFTGYALTQSAAVAALLFVVDGASTSLTIAQRTYIQKIGDREDMTATTSVAFTFNHIAAVVIPVVFGALGHRDPSIIFWLGTGIAMLSLSLAFLVPRTPEPGNESNWGWLTTSPGAATRPAPQPAE